MICIFLKKEGFLITRPREYVMPSKINLAKEILKGLRLYTKRLKILQYLLPDRFVIVKGEHVFRNHSKSDVKFFLKKMSHTKRFTIKTSKNITHWKY